VNVTIDPRSIDADGAPAGFMATLAGPEWLDAGRFPQMTYRSTKVGAPARTACASVASSRCTA
jgi:polyisoprenoid-binding protein YceI